MTVWEIFKAGLRHYSWLLRFFCYGNSVLYIFIMGLVISITRWEFYRSPTFWYCGVVTVAFNLTANWLTELSKTK